MSEFMRNRQFYFLESYWNNRRRRRNKISFEILLYFLKNKRSQGSSREFQCSIKSTCNSTSRTINAVVTITGWYFYTSQELIWTNSQSSIFIKYSSRIKAVKVFKLGALIPYENVTNPKIISFVGYQSRFRFRTLIQGCVIRSILDI